MLNKNGLFLHFLKEILNFSFCICKISNHLLHDKWNSAKRKFFKCCPMPLWLHLYIKYVSKKHWHQKLPTVVIGFIRDCNVHSKISIRDIGARSKLEEKTYQPDLQMIQWKFQLDAHQGLRQGFDVYSSYYCLLHKRLTIVNTL